MNRKYIDKHVFLKNTIMLYILTAAKYIFPFIVTACLTRRLGSDNYGTITFINALMNYFLFFFDFGFNYSATKHISQNRDYPLEVQKTISEVFTCKLFLVVIGFLPLFIIMSALPMLQENCSLVILYYISTASNVFIFDFLYRGLEKMEYVTIRYSTSKLISTVLIFLIVKTTDQMYLIPIFNLLGTLIAAIITFRHILYNLGFSISFSHWKHALLSLRKSFSYFLSTIASTVLGVFNTLMIGVIGFTSHEIAYWGVAFQVVSAIQALYEPIISSIYPHVAAKKDYRFVLKFSGILMIAVAVGCIILFFCAKYIVMLLAGKDYLPAVPVMCILIPVIFFSFPAQMLGFPLLGTLGKQNLVTLSTLITAAFHIAASLLLIVANTCTLISMSVLRSISEFLFFILRLVFFFSTCLAIKKTSSKTQII